MTARREFLKTAGVLLATLACNPAKLLAPKKPQKFAAWSYTSATSPFPLQLTTLNAGSYRQYSLPFVTPALLDFARANPGCLYINGDEPDQNGITPEDYATRYHDWSVQLKAADPTSRLSPAGFAEPNPVAGLHSTDYASAFYEAYKTKYGVYPTVDEWRFHDFGLDRQGDLSAWWTRVTACVEWSVSHGAPMVLGSWGFIDWPEPELDFLSHMREAKALIQGEARINQAVWWSYGNTGVPRYLVNQDGTLTLEGQVYAEAM